MRFSGLDPRAGAFTIASMTQVTPQSFLTLHYRLGGPQGDIINTFTGKPATLSLGEGRLSPALEEKLLGLEEGSRHTFDLPAGAAFGEHNAQMMQWVARSLLKELGDPLEQYHVGEVLQFPTPDGQGHYAGAILQVEEDRILCDFNHPLAGQPVQFEVQLIGVL